LEYEKAFEEFRSFTEMQQSITTSFQAAAQMYDFNKNSLISEFSLSEFNEFFEKTRIYFTKNFEDLKNVFEKLDVSDRIAKMMNFEDSKMLFSSKKFLPKNMMKIYFPVEKQNILSCYCSETDTFSQVRLNPNIGQKFTFKHFNRFVNYFGRLFVTGGYEESKSGLGKASKTIWIIEDNTNVNFKNIDLSLDKKFNEENINAELKKMNENSIIDEDSTNTTKTTYRIIKNLYQSILKENLYEDSDNPDYRIIRAHDMMFGHAGHGMVCYSPKLLLVFAGVDNNTKCEIFHIEQNRWEEISSLNVSRIDPSVLIFKSYIYIFFGINYDQINQKVSFIDSIERISFLQIQKGKWEFISPSSSIEENLNLGRSLCGIVPKSNSSIIYILGGMVGNNEYSDDILQYNLDANFLSISEKKLPKPTCFYEPNFSFLYKTALNFDLDGDILYYHASEDKFSLKLMTK